MSAPNHIRLLHNTKKPIKTKDGALAEVWEVRFPTDTAILSQWADHFRKQYCLDCEIDDLRDGTGLSRRDYLTQMVFPDRENAPGPGIRSGDFAEILIADFVEYLLGYQVPRIRYDMKDVPNESTKGVDVLGFKIRSANFSPADELITCEVKASLTSFGQTTNRLQDAINDSPKDICRCAYTLNAIKRRLLRDKNKGSQKGSNAKC